jgi:hypothetical protein
MGWPYRPQGLSHQGFLQLRPFPRASSTMAVPVRQQPKPVVLRPISKKTFSYSIFCFLSIPDIDTVVGCRPSKSKNCVLSVMGYVLGCKYTQYLVTISGKKGKINDNSRTPKDRFQNDSRLIGEIGENLT